MLTMDEARGIAARIWLRTNNKRKVMDAQLCEDIADVLVDEVTKRTLDNKEFEDTKAENVRLRERILEDQKTFDKDSQIQKLNMANLQTSIDKAQLEFVNLQSEHENLKLKVKPDEVV